MTIYAHAVFVIFSILRIELIHGEWQILPVMIIPALTSATSLEMVHFAMGISFENDVVATCYYMFKNDIKKPIELQYNKSDYETEGRWPHEVYTIVLSLLAWHKQGKISELVDEMNAEPDLYKRSKLIFKLCEVVGMCDFKEELAKSK